MQKFKSVVELVNQLKPIEPVYCIRKKSIQLASKYFQNKFPGNTLYALKTNPNPLVLKTKFLDTLRVLSLLHGLRQI